LHGTSRLRFGGYSRNENSQCCGAHHANELGPQGIRVNAIAPSIITTPGLQDQMEPLRQRGIDVDEKIAANPLGIAGHPDHIARGVIFLITSLEASSSLLLTSRRS